MSTAINTGITSSGHAIFKATTLDTTSQAPQDTRLDGLDVLTADDVDETFLASVQEVQNAGRWDATSWAAVTTDLAARTTQASLIVDLIAGTVIVADVGGANPSAAISLAAPSAAWQKFGPKMLPTDGATLDLNEWYYGRTNTYIIPDGVDGDFVLIDNPSNLKGEATRPSFTGRFSYSTNGAFFSGTLSISPNGRWRLYWDSSLDNGGGAWRIHSNRSLIIPITYPQDRDILLARNNDYALYNSAAATDVFTVRVPKVPSGRIRIRYDNLSTGPLRIKMQDGTVPDNLSYNGLIGSEYDFGTKYKGQEFSIEANTTTGHWVIYIDSTGEMDEPIVALAADNKPIAYKARRVTADTTLDLTDVPAEEGILYGISLGVATLSGDGFADIQNTGPNFEPIWFESTGTAGELRRFGNDVSPTGVQIDLTDANAGDYFVLDSTKTKLVKGNAPAQARSFAGYFTLNGANQYFIAEVAGTYDIKETRVTATNNALFTVIKRVATGATIYTSFSNRITNTNTQNTASANLLEGATYVIDVASGGGTTSGSHKVEITLR